MSVPALILSDLHLGAPHSTLNLKQWNPSEVQGVKHGEAARDALARGIKQEVGNEELDRLILLGDVIDLSHGTMADGLAELVTLIRRIRDAVTVNELVLVPGNHDRHWWDLQCQYDSLIKPLLANQEAQSNTDYPRTTDTAGRRVNIPVITGPLLEHQDLPITLAYPDYEFTVGGKRIRCLHGHLFEDLYLFVADLLKGVLEDLGDIRRRDPIQAPTAKQRKRFDAVTATFGDSLNYTLDPGMGAQAELELAERLSAPIVNLDWLFLGQTGLLRRQGANVALARRLNDVLSEATDDDKDAVLGLTEFMALSAMDIIARREDGKPHSYSNNAFKSLLVEPIIKAVVDALIDGNDDLPLKEVDAPSDSLSRGRDLSDMKPAIERYLERFQIPRPNLLICGHTHVKGQATFTKSGAAMRVMNTGSWTSSKHRKVPDSRICRIGPQGGLNFNDVDLKP